MEKVFLLYILKIIKQQFYFILFMYVHILFIYVYIITNKLFINKVKHI